VEEVSFLLRRANERGAAKFLKVSRFRHLSR
jgi:hypothetical protein